MKKKNRTLYIFVAILVILGLAGGIVLSLGGPIGNRVGDEQNKQGVGEDQSGESQDQSSQRVFNTGKSTGGQEGQYYYITGFSFKKVEDFDRITITFQGRGTDSGVPFYSVIPEESALIVTFSDTSDFNLTRGQSTFDGEKSLSTNGFVVKTVALSYPEADNTIALAIETNTSEFGYLVDEESLKLVIDIK